MVYRMVALIWYRLCYSQGRMDPGMAQIRIPRPTIFRGASPYYSMAVGVANLSIPERLGMNVQNHVV